MSVDICRLKAFAINPPQAKYADLLMNMEAELNRLKEKINIGHELEVKWIPGTIRFQNGKQLEEEVKGNMIFIYVEQHDKAIELMKHGFVEWLLNQHSKPYRQLINKLIDVFEEIQYERKEKIIEALTKLL